MKVIRLILLPSLVLSLAGCAGHDRRLNSSSTQYLTPGGQIVKKPSGAVDTVSYWDGNGVAGSPSQ